MSKTTSTNAVGGPGHHPYRRYLQCGRSQVFSTPSGVPKRESEDGRGGTNHDYHHHHRNKLLDTTRESSKNSTPTSSPKSKGRVCCILTGGFGRCRTKAGSHHFSENMEVETDKHKLNMKADSRACHRFMCNAHKEFIAAALQSDTESETETDGDSGNGYHRHRDESPVQRAKYPQLNWHMLPINTLKKYLLAFSIKGYGGATKDELIHVISRHYDRINVSDIEDFIVGEFIFNVKRRKYLGWIGE